MALSYEELNKKVINKGIDTEILHEKDEDGIDTGNLINKYSKKYFEKLLRLREYQRNFRTANIGEKGNSYNKVISFHKENDILIDPSKILYFKNKFGNNYSEYFNYSEEEMNNYEKYLKNILGKKYSEVIDSLEKKLWDYEQYRELQETNNINGKKNISLIYELLFRQALS